MTLPDPTTQPTLRVEEVAELLDIGRGLTYDLVRDGTIPSLRLGRNIRIPTARLLSEFLGVDPFAGEGPATEEDPATDSGALSVAPDQQKGADNDHGT